MPPAVEITVIADASRRGKLRALIGIGGSLLLHASLFGMVTGWLSWGLSPIDPISFEGRQRVITLQASWSLPAEEKPLEQLEAAIPVEITPHQARIEEQRFVEVAHAELALPALVETPAFIKQDHSTPQVVEMPPQETPVLPRTQRATPPSVSRTATLPSTLGTSETEPPIFANNQPPSYPELARQRRWQGTVLLELHIAADGRVSEVKIATSSGHEILDLEAVHAVRQWKAKPARRGGMAVATVEMLPVRFRLD